MAAVLFDFFGTLVSYSPSRTEQGYPRADDVLRRAGCRLPYDDWLTLWSLTSERMDSEADQTGIEFSMRELFHAFAGAAGLGASTELMAEEFISAYLDEWSSAVSVVAGVPELLVRLRRCGHELVLVTNTHDAGMVRGHLQSMGIEETFTAVVTSVEVGYRKPRPEIFHAALAAAGTTAANAVFVGDSFRPDYLGPTRVGIEAFLVTDGFGRDSEVPRARCLGSVLEIEAMLPG
jgi:putative hydrolase of the HAD superfamily